VITAFRAGFRRSILARKYRVSSTLEIFFADRLLPSSPMDRLCNIVT
jgi:hypothetical protein